jgi:hypothetical protein
LGKEQISAYETLYYVLVEFSKIFAPFAPFVSDRVYRNLTEGMTGVAESVHLTDIPLADPKAIDRDLEENMALVRRATELGRSLRAKHQIKTRQPLPSLLVITRNERDKRAIDNGRNIIQDELNVKSIEFSTDEARFLSLSVKPNLKTLGKKLGGALSQVRSAFEEMSKDPAQVAVFLASAEKIGTATVAGHQLTLEDLFIERGPKDDRLIATEAGVTVLLDTKVTENLLFEGYAREVVSRVQNLRKEFWSDVAIPGEINDFNPELDKAMRVADFLEQGELMVIDALNRKESCGGHYRVEYQEQGEAKRDQPDHWGSGGYAVLVAAELGFENISLVGFDLYSKNNKVNNIYKGTNNYAAPDSHSIDYNYWVYQVSKIFHLYPSTQFTILNQSDWVLPGDWQLPNVQFRNIEQLVC